MSSLIVLAAYLALSLLYFFQLPWKGQLPGNTDTLLAIALSNTFVEKVQLLLSGLGHGLSVDTSLHPAGAVYAYGENCAGLGFFFLFFRLITGSDIWGYYLFVSSLFALNSFAMFKLAGLFVRDWRAAFLAGLAISFAAFTLSNVDDPNVVFIFLPVMAWYFLEKGIRERHFSAIRNGFLLSGLQIWFGLYVFVFQSIALAIFAAAVLAGGRWKPGRGQLLSAALVFLGPVLPLAGLYMFNARYRDVYSPYDNSYIVRAASLSWQYFLNVLPNNLLYLASHNLHRGENLDKAGWYTLRKTCFSGVLFPAFAALGIVVSRKKTQVYLAILILFLLLSLGTNLPFFEDLSHLPFGAYFRVPLRLYLFALASLSLFFGIGADIFLKTLTKKPYWVTALAAAAIGIVYVGENAPFPFPGYAYAGLIGPPSEYLEYFKGSSVREVVLDLPSTYRARLPDWAVLWTYNREALYMNWQTRHRQVIVGGVNGYLPMTRVRTQELIDSLPGAEAIAGLKRIGVTFIVFHRNLILIPEEDVLGRLKQSAALKLRLDQGDTTIFQIL